QYAPRKRRRSLTSPLVASRSPIPRRVGDVACTAPSPSFLFMQENTMIVSTDSTSAADRMAAWRRQIGHRHTVAAERGPRPFAVISFRVQGALVEERYVPLRRLTLVALYDQP